MELNTRNTILNNINLSLQNVPEYNPCNFVEDALQIKSIITSELRNQSDFKLSLNKLRSILRDNKPLFCSLFTNLINPYLSLLSNENVLSEEYIYLLVDILHNKQEIEKYFKKWIEQILSSLIAFYAKNFESKNIDHINKTCSYIEFWIDEFISIDDKSINQLIYLFDDNDIKVQKMSAFFFFKYINRYDINKIKIINWKSFFEICADALESRLFLEENKNVINDIFKQIYEYFKQIKVDPNDALVEGKSLSAAKYFQSITGLDTSKAKEKLRD